MLLAKQQTRVKREVTLAEIRGTAGDKSNKPIGKPVRDYIKKDSVGSLVPSLIPSFYRFMNSKKAGGGLGTRLLIRYRWHCSGTCVGEDGFIEMCNWSDWEWCLLPKTTAQYPCTHQTTFKIHHSGLLPSLPFQAFKVLVAMVMDFVSNWG